MRVLWAIPLAFSCGGVDKAKPDAKVFEDAPPCTGSMAFAYTGALQMFTTPCSARFTFTAHGAAGGDSGTATGSGSGAGSGSAVLVPGGKGALASGAFDLDANTMITILVGGRGVDGFDVPTGGGTGGGGTFIVDATMHPLVVAGGGGGGQYNSIAVSAGPGGDGQAGMAGGSGYGTTVPGMPGGINAGGGTSSNWTGYHGGAGGGGFYGDGIGVTTGTNGTPDGPGLSFVHGGGGGSAGSMGRPGGYGGGGAAGFTGGGGGGFAGGGGGGLSQSTTPGTAGGGGSYSADPKGMTMAGENVGSGAVSITWGPSSVSQ